MKIPGAHLQMVSNQCTISEKSMHLFLRTCVDNIMSSEGGQTNTERETDARTDRQTDKQTDRQTHRVKPIYSPCFFGVGYND